MTRLARQMKRERERPSRRRDERLVWAGIMRELQASAAAGDRDALWALRAVDGDESDDAEALTRLTMWFNRRLDAGTLPPALLRAWARIS